MSDMPKAIQDTELLSAKVNLLALDVLVSAIPGSTNAYKLAWVQNAAAGIYACARGGNCDSGAEAAAKAMAKTLDEINEAIIKFMSTDEDAAKTLATIMGIVGRVE